MIMLTQEIVGSYIIEKSYVVPNPKPACLPLSLLSSVSCIAFTYCCKNNDTTKEEVGSCRPAPRPCRYKDIRRGNKIN